jgi:sarcosine oxidase subunit beta
MRTLQADIAIVGGGIMGSATALFLQEKGRRAIVLERGALAAEASGLNGGGVRQQGRQLPEIPLARRAVELWGRLDELLGRPTGYRRTGNLMLARNEAELEMLAGQRLREQGAGLESELVDAEQVRELAPGVAPGAFVGGKFCPTDGHTRPAQTAQAVAEAAREAGAQLHTNNRVLDVGVSGGRVAYIESAELRVEAPVVLDAAGPWAPYISQFVDVYLPIFPTRAHQLLTPPLEPITGPFLITATWDFGGSQHADGRVQFGGGDVLDDSGRVTFSKRILPWRVDEIKRRAARLLPALGSSPIERAWVGTYECTPDMMPIIGPVEEPEGFFVCAGFSGHGFCLGPLMGQLMAEWIVGGAPSIDLSAFHYRRFQRAAGPDSAPRDAVQRPG